ncbi:hypothetical protein IGK80_001137 [Enterococcus sp. DIV0609]|uniref:hypothetical protein n=1 Tax=unclassified Enterococcus TaxID=2608891 RepID=UPI003F20D381
MQNTVTTEFCKDKSTQSESAIQEETEEESVQNSVMTEFCKNMLTKNASKTEEKRAIKNV